MQKVLITGFCTEDRINNTSYFGGAAGGIVLNLAAQSIPVGILSVLGKDAFSQQYIAELTKREVNLELLSQVATHLPQLTVISQDNTEKSRMFDDFGCKDILASLTPSEEELQKYPVLHVVNTPKRLCDYLAEHYKGQISYCPGSFLMRDPQTLSLDLLQKAQFLFCNEEEYEQLEKRVNIRDLFSSNLRFLCLTKGENGITIYTKDQTIDLSPIPVPHVVDTTGGGDAVIVGFLIALSQGDSLIDGIKNGQLLAAKIVQQNGVLLHE